jgi:uncharacterized protein YbjT (DUF2867 family)
MTVQISSPDAGRILVTGGTGTLGSLVVARLRDAGRVVRVFSRNAPSAAEPIGELSAGVEFVTGDLATGEGIDAAVRDAQIIVHVAGSAKGDEDKARNLVNAAVRTGTPHIVYISVVGADRVPVTSRLDRAMFGYFASKLAAEQAISDSGLPWTTLRSTQFLQLTFKTVSVLARLPVVPVPSGFRFQPVDAAEVADRLVELALGKPQGLVPDIGGPRVYEMAELVRSYLRASGKHRWIIPAPVVGKAAAAIRAGANLRPDRAIGRKTWEEFLADQLDGSTRSQMRPGIAAGK